MYRTSWIVLTMVATALVITPDTHARTWTDSTGRFKIDAEFVDFADGVVELEKTDGEVITVPIDRLSSNDRLYIRRQMVKRRDAPSPATTTARGGASREWPRFHGPDGTNISPDTGLLRSWPAEGPKLIWEASGLGRGFSSVSIANGAIYTAGNVGNVTQITALDMNGQLLWKAANGPPWTGSYEGSRGTPTVDGDRVYHKSPLGNLVCLNAKTGQAVWGGNVLETFGGQNIQWALAESVLIDGDRVICCPGGRTSMVALNKMNGNPVWRAEGTGHKTGYASPVLVEYKGVRMILAMTAKALIGVNADNGQLLFGHPHETQYDVNATDPIFHNGRVFITSGYGAGSEMVELSVGGGRVGVQRVWQSKEMDNHHGGVILYEGHLYGSASKANGARWICLDWNTGQMKYAERGVGKGSLTMAEGMLYTLSEKNKMGIAQATPSGLSLTGEFRVPSGGPDPSWAHPVVLDGRLYIRHADKLYVYDVKGG